MASSAMTSPVEREALSVKEIADRYNIPIRTVYAEIASGRLPAIRFGATDRAIRVLRKDFDAWLDRRRVAA
jgi:excisionase family DNA binding protein